MKFLPGDVVLWRYPIKNGRLELRPVIVADIDARTNKYMLIYCTNYTAEKAAPTHHIHVSQYGFIKPTLIYPERWAWDAEQPGTLRLGSIPEELLDQIRNENDKWRAERQTASSAMFMKDVIRRGV